MALGKLRIENYLPVVKLNEGITTKYSINAASGTATTAGGSTTGLQLGSAAVGIYFGSGAPTITAVKGSLYLRTDGSTTSDRAYINTNGATTWTALTTAA